MPWCKGSANLLGGSVVQRELFYPGTSQPHTDQMGKEYILMGTLHKDETSHAKYCVCSSTVAIGYVVWSNSFTIGKCDWILENYSWAESPGTHKKQ